MKNLFLLNFVLLALLFTSCSSTPEVIEDGKVRAMSFNIRYGTAKDGDNHWEKRKAMVFKVIKDYAPDFVGMQEALKFQIDEIVEANSQYKSAGIGRDGENKGEFSNILYNHLKFELLENETFWLSDTPETMSKSWGNGLHRICTWALLKNKVSGKHIYVFNTHFDHRSVPSRVQSARLIIQKIKERQHLEYPFILTGDFNAIESSLEMNYFSSNNILDSDRFVDHEDQNRGSFTGFKFGNYKHKIDYIYISAKQWNVKKSEIVRYSENEKYPSDHFPIYAELEIKEKKK
ncbi:MAG: endonuclease/exonuclease/phosphatase family protein [Lentisphaeraceae bacterium]|nr:endonuclease/exonuclease/phosphatase family protein [Lentisphaeraceae bacterium]